VAGTGAILASVMSATVDLPIVARLTRDRALTWRLARVLAGIVLLAVVGTILQAYVPVSPSWIR